MQKSPRSRDVSRQELPYLDSSLLVLPPPLALGLDLASPDILLGLDLASPTSLCRRILSTILAYTYSGFNPSTPTMPCVIARHKDLDGPGIAASPV